MTKKNFVYLTTMQVLYKIRDIYAIIN